MAEILANLDKIGISLAGKQIFEGLSWEIQQGTSALVWWGQTARVNLPF